MTSRLLLAFTLFSSAAWAQTPVTKGTITYEQTVQMRRNLVGINPAIANQIPQSRTSRFELLFTPDATLFRKAEEESGDMVGGDGSMRFSVRTVGGGDGGDLFRNLKTGVMVHEQDLGDDTYLVVDTLQRRTGNLANVPDSVRQRMSKLKLFPDSSKMIAGYPCQRASFTTQMRVMSHAQTQEMRRQMMEGANNGGSMRMLSGLSNVQGDSSYTAETVLWYTTQIPVQAGPALFGNLPGMVLEVILDNGRITYTAIDVSAQVREKEVKQPSSGKQVTQKEFQEKMMAFMEKMRQSGGGMRTMRF